MDSSAIVAVFPNVYSRPHAALLARNVRAMLRARKLRFTSVARDGDVITIDAHDPVFASTAAAQLFGTERVAIARPASTKLRELVEMISLTASSLLLGGERFVVRVTGKTQGYLPRDAEIAATSSIISSKKGAKPGTESSHDRVIYAHVSKKNSYVSIFSDVGRGGVPFGLHADRVACPVYDELSAIAMLEVMHQGHDVLPVVSYATDSARMRLAKPVCRIVSSIPRGETDAEFVQISAARGATLARAALDAAITSAKSSRLKRVCIPTSPLLAAEPFSDALAERVRAASLVPMMPLAGAELQIRTYARAAGIDNIEKRLVRLAAGKTQRVRELDRRRIVLRVGPSMLHDTLDSFSSGN